jgi:Family of unknown function (DUF6788)
MPQSLSDSEQKREVIAQRITQLGDLRPGGVTSTSARCGKPDCRCHQPGQPGHGPNFRLTYKVEGKTISEALPTPATIHKAEREVEEFREFQQLTHELLRTNVEICRLENAVARFCQSVYIGPRAYAGRYDRRARGGRWHRSRSW